MRRITFKAIALLFFISESLPAAVDTADYLNIGVGGRALGMGGAFTAVADDATAAYWNPAGLCKLEGYNASFMMQRLLDDEWPGMEDISPSYQFGNFIVPMDKLGIAKKGTIGISVIAFQISNIPYTYVDSDGAISRNVFEDAERAFYFSAGYPLLDDVLMVGGSFKYLTQSFANISEAQARGWDMDAGLLIYLSKRFNVGFMANRGAELNWDGGYTDKDSLQAKLGLGYKYPISSKMEMLGTCDIIQKKDNPLMGSFRTGVDRLTLENRYNNIADLNEIIKWTAGMGIVINAFLFDTQIDYAYGFHRLGAKHRISLIIKLL